MRIEHSDGPHPANIALRGDSEASFSERHKRTRIRHALGASRVDTLPARYG
jgi:hypothetical protein